MLATGAGVADIPVPIGTQAEADHLFGAGSQLAAMFRKFFKNNFAQEVWAGPVVEPETGKVAAGTITVSHAPTSAGQIVLYIAGQRVLIGVNADDDAADVAANIVTAINAMDSLPVTAALAFTTGAVVDVTCRWKGETGNDIVLTDSYYGSRGGEVLPLGLTLTYGAMTAGDGAPSLDALILAMGDEPYEYVASAFNDDVSWLALDTEYGFGDTGRWGWLRELYGHVFTAKRGAYGDLILWGDDNNSGVISVMGWEAKVPSPMWECAAAYTAKAARALLNDPARPLQTLTLDGILPARKHDRFLITERNNLAGVGVATQATGADGVPMIMRESTSYQFNKYGQSDDAYELVTTLATLARLFRNQKAAITSKYPRHKLADDDTRFGPGQAIVTPKVIKAELVVQYSIDEFNGLVENVNAFKANLIVERNSSNQDRLDVLYGPDLINGLRIFAVLAQFRLQYSRGLDTLAA
jgi:phage tail sheath gpL-like